MGLILDAPWTWRSLVHEDIRLAEIARKWAAKMDGDKYYEAATSNPWRDKAGNIFPGLRAELALHDLLGIPFDWEGKEAADRKGDDGIDIILVPGVATGQIKFTGGRNGHLLFREWDKFDKATVGILATPVVNGSDLGNIEFRGWIRRLDFWRIQEVRFFKYFSAPSVTQEQLLDMDALEEARFAFFPVSLVLSPFCQLTPAALSPILDPWGKSPLPQPLHLQKRRGTRRRKNQGPTWIRPRRLLPMIYSPRRDSFRSDAPVVLPPTSTLTTSSSSPLSLQLLRIL